MADEDDAVTGPGTGTLTLPRRPKKPRHRSGPSPAPEVRMFAPVLEVRAAADGSDTIEITGEPIVYSQPYVVRDFFGEFIEVMEPGVATNVLANNCDCRLLVNHAGLPISRTSAGTMDLIDSPGALTFVARIDTRQSIANDLVVAIERGDVSQMSCGFVVAPNGDEWVSDNERHIYRFADLLDVSAVTYPASPTTSIAIAERMMLEAPVESRARVRRMWAISRELHEGRTVSREDVDLLAQGLKALAEAAPEETEDRAAPTKADPGIMAKVQAAHDAVSGALKAQAGDPDNGTDPDDSAVFGHLKNALTHTTKALQAQATDSAPGAPAAGDGDTQLQGDGTSGASGTGNDDNAGTRSTGSLALELEMLKLQRQRRRRVA
jgi:HK97 family phage prohead protease